MDLLCRIVRRLFLCPLLSAQGTKDTQENQNQPGGSENQIDGISVPGVKRLLAGNGDIYTSDTVITAVVCTRQKQFPTVPIHSGAQTVICRLEKCIPVFHRPEFRAFRVGCRDGGPVPGRNEKYVRVPEFLADLRAKAVVKA